MERQTIFPAGRPKAGSPLSPGVRIGNLLFTSGAVGREPNGNVPPDIVAQTRTTFENLRTVLTAAGTSFDRVVKATVYLTDMKDFAAMNEVYCSFFSGDLPARTTIGVAALARPELKIEIEMTAHVPE